MTNWWHQIAPDAVAIAPERCEGCGADKFTLHWESRPLNPFLPPPAWTICQYCGRREELVRVSTDRILGRSYFGEVEFR